MERGLARNVVFGLVGYELIEIDQRHMMFSGDTAYRSSNRGNSPQRANIFFTGLI